MGACGETRSSSGASFGAPDISDIVDSAASSLTTQALVAASGDLRPFSCPTDGTFSAECAASAAAYIGFLQAGVFNKATNSSVAGPQYYRWWVDVVDAALAETEQRLAGNDEAPACLSETATAVDFVFTINGSDETVSPKLQCWENQGATPEGGEQDFAFGKDDTHYYLVYRTSDSCTTNGCGTRFLLAKASIDGNEADIWNVGYSWQSGAQSANAQRVLANKTTGEFTFNLVEDPIDVGGMGFLSFYGNTDGTNAYFEATTSISNNKKDIPNLIPGTGGCFLTSDLSSAGDCSGLDRNAMPQDFGPSLPMSMNPSEDAGGDAEDADNSITEWLADGTEQTAFFADLDAIGSMDLSAEGVTEWTTD